MFGKKQGNEAKETQTPKVPEKREDYWNPCICERCPTYVKCGPGEKAFCFHEIGKSKCIKQEKGCICGGCPVKRRMKLKNFYFCTKGSEQ
jgi:hypothetical protein